MRVDVHQHIWTRPLLEALPRETAIELIDAHLDGVATLGSRFGAWGPVPLDRPRPDDVDAQLQRGCVGGVPLFVHPGPAPGHSLPEASPTEPLWWRALTDYVAQMRAAWLTFATLVRREHPGLVVVFAMLAGGAPLLSERLAARGGPRVDLQDPRVFYDTSSYASTAIAMMGACVGAAQLLYGSDRPVLERAPRDDDAERLANGARLVGQMAVAA